MTSTGATRVHIGTDHTGFHFALRLADHLREDGYDVVHHGAHVHDPADDYPAPCFAAAAATAASPGSLGVVIGGSGNGEQMSANLVPGVRAALVWNENTAVLARSHNDANVISLGARQLGEPAMLRLVEVFLREPFSGEPRHERRIRQMDELRNRAHAR